MASWGEPGGRPEGRNPSGQRTEELVEAVAFISVKNNKYIPTLTYERHMESLQAAGCRLNAVCPQRRDKVAVAGLPIKPSQVQSHCVAGHRFFFPSLRSLSFPFPFGLLVAWGSELPRCLLGIARKGSPWASRAAPQAWASACFRDHSAERAGHRRGWRARGRVLRPEKSECGGCDSLVPGESLEGRGSPQQCSLLVAASVCASTQLPKGHTLLRKRAPASRPL